MVKSPSVNTGDKGLSLVWEDHTCCGATKLVRHSYRSLCSLSLCCTRGHSYRSLRGLSLCCTRGHSYRGLGGLSLCCTRGHSYRSLRGLSLCCSRGHSYRSLRGLSLCCSRGHCDKETAHERAAPLAATREKAVHQQRPSTTPNNRKVNKKCFF